MIIEYELNGSKQVHRGMFETTGFWLRIENMADRPMPLDGVKQEGFVLCNHGSFGFYHESEEAAESVLKAILGAIECANYSWEHPDLGWVRSGSYQ